MDNRLCFEELKFNRAGMDIERVRTFVDVRFGFVASRSLLSWTIREVTNGDVSHVMMVYHDPLFDAEMVAEADWNGLIIRTRASVEREHGTRIVCVLRPPVAVDVGLRAAKEYLDAPYDFGGLAGEALVLFWRRLGRRVKNPLHSSRALFCSDIAVLVCQWGGYPGADELDAASTDPMSLKKWMLATGSTCEA